MYRLPMRTWRRNETPSWLPLNAASDGVSCANECHCASSSAPGLFFAVIIQMQSRQHVNVKDSSDDYAVLSNSVEDDMLPLFHAPIAWPQMFTRSSQLWIIGEFLAAGFKPVYVARTLHYAPGANGIFADFKQIFLGTAS